MKVIQAESAGFCWGVKRAIEKARRLAAESNGPIQTDGPLIHNRQMMEILKNEGVFSCDCPETLKTGTLLIRAHGIPPERRKRLRSLPVKLQDATCPDVARIQSAIKQRAARGVMVVIYGDKGHPEVTGLLGFAGDYGRVISGCEDVAALPEHQPVTLVSQSTQFPSAYKKVAQQLQERFPDAEILDTICESTRQRQAELSEIAKKVDAMVVVGGTHSANTRRLVELAESLCPVQHVETADQLDLAKLAGCRAVGLIGGASTPDFLLQQVRKRIEEAS